MNGRPQKKHAAEIAHEFFERCPDTGKLCATVIRWEIQVSNGISVGQGGEGFKQFGLLGRCRGDPSEMGLTTAMILHPVSRGHRAAIAVRTRLPTTNTFGRPVTSGHRRAESGRRIGCTENSSHRGVPRRPEATGYRAARKSHRIR